MLNDSETVTAESLRDWINERVAARYQRVHQVVFMEDFPRSVVGKTLKRVMRESYWVGKKEKI